MSNTKNPRKEEQPGLEVVPQPQPQPEVDKTTLPETNYVENEASPPPQEFQITSSHGAHHPLFRPSSLYDGPGSGPGGAQFAHMHMHAKELPAGTGTDSKTEYSDLTTPTATMMYPPTINSPGGGDLEENRRVFLPVQEISHSEGADGRQAQAVEVMKRVPLWRRKKFWVIVGIIAGVIVVIGGIVGGVVAGRD